MSSTRAKRQTCPNKAKAPPKNKRPHASVATPVEQEEEQSEESAKRGKYLADLIVAEADGGPLPAPPPEEPPAKPELPEYQVINVVATFDLGDVLFDLRQLANQYLLFDYNPRRFAAATWRIKEPKTTALMFPRGRFVCTGAKSGPESQLAAHRYTRVLRKLGHAVFLQNFTIQNIVACAACGFLVKLAQLSIRYSAYVSYEPALFPGCIFRMPNKGLVFLVFRSGKVVITGAKEKSHITREWAWFFEHVLCEYRDQDRTQSSSAEYRLFCQRISADSLADDIVGKVIEIALESRADDLSAPPIKDVSDIQDALEQSSGIGFEVPVVIY